MALVETVTGPVDTAELGVTLAHEHVFMIDPEIERNYPERWDEEERVSHAVHQVRDMMERGVRTILEPTVLGHGRYVPRVKRVAEETGLQIVAATGLYTFNDLPAYALYQGPGTVLGGDDPLVELFVKDLTEGIADTGVKAAFLKCATDEPGVVPGVERVLRATAVAHRETGAPIMTHTHAATKVGLDQQRIFAEEGVDLGRVIIGHSGDTTDLDYLEQLIDAGSYLGMDRFGLDLFLPFDDRVATVAALCERGYADRLLLSHDAICHYDALPGGRVPDLLPDWRFTHIHDDVLPALRERGVSETQIDQMLVHNVRALFEAA